MAVVTHCSSHIFPASSCLLWARPGSSCLHLAPWSSPTLRRCPILARPEDLGWSWNHLVGAVTASHAMCTPVEASPAHRNPSPAHK